MSEPRINESELIFRVMELADIEALAESLAAFCARRGWRADQAAVLDQKHASEWLRTARLAPEWLGVFALNPANEVAGSGGFRSAPDAEGFIEIGYGVAPAFRSRGVATAIAAYLCEAAFASPAVTSVCAHTLPDGHASIQVLERNGFVRVGTAQDPDEGEVVRWEKRR